MAELERLLAGVDGAREELIGLHQALVRIPTVNTGVMPTGNETALAEYIKPWLASRGVDSEILESALGRGNLIARVKGDGTGPSVLLMSHMDVVPVEDESKWAHPPFCGDIIDGCVFGRGSQDCKGVIAPQLLAVALLKQAGLRLKGDLILGSTADEESGGFYGYGWLMKNFPEKIQADYAINEGGGIPLPSPKGWLYGLGIGEKGRLEATISIAGRSGHASRPWIADNALLKAGQVLTALAAYQPEIEISHPVFDHMFELVEGLQRPTLGTMEEVIARVAEANPPIAVELRGLTRMTVTPTILHGGVKSNSIPASAVLKCDVRTLPGQDIEYVRREIAKALRGIEGIQVDLEVWAQSGQSKFGTPFTRLLERSLQVAVDAADVRLLPTSTLGFTDSQYTRQLGIQTYGFAPLRLGASSSRSGSHGVNENLEVETLFVRAKTYLAALYFALVEGIGA